MVVNVQIPSAAWEEVGPEEDPGAGLLAHVRIGDCDFHAEAFAVKQFRQEQYAVDPGMEDRLTALGDVDGDGGPFQTLRMFERDYVLVIYPYQA